LLIINIETIVNLAKRLTEKQKREIIESFQSGKTTDFLSDEFNCTKLTIIRNLKMILGESRYKQLVNINKKSIKNNIVQEKVTKKNLNIQNRLDDCDKGIQEVVNSKDNDTSKDFYPDSSFIEISPLDYQIENLPRKELSSIHISEVDFPPIVYMVVDKKIELEIKLLKDFPSWSFLPLDDLNRKVIEIYYDLKIAKRFCNKEQKVIKVPNTNVFKIASSFLLKKGITRIVSTDILIAL